MNVKHMVPAPAQSRSIAFLGRKLQLAMCHIPLLSLKYFFFFFLIFLKVHRLVHIHSLTNEQFDKGWCFSSCHSFSASASFAPIHNSSLLLLQCSSANVYHVQRQPVVKTAFTATPLETTPGVFRKTLRVCVQVTAATCCLLSVLFCLCSEISCLCFLCEDYSYCCLYARTLSGSFQRCAVACCE